MLPRSRCARTPSALRRWLRFAWLDRLPRLAAWLHERLAGPPRTADHRREPRRPVQPGVLQLETRWVPNDLFGPLLSAGGLATPFLVLMRGWGAGRLPEPGLPAVAPAATSRPMAASDALFAAAPPARSAATEPAAQAPAPTISAASTATAGRASPGGDGPGSPLGTDWLQAVDDVFGGPPARPRAGSGPADHGTGEGGGGGSGAAAFVAPDFSSPASGGGVATGPASDLASLAGLGGTGRTPAAATASSVGPSAPHAAAPASHSSGPVRLRFGADGTQGGGTTPPPQAQPNFGRIPLAFEPNVGQTNSAVAFYSHGPGFSLFLTGSAATFALPLTGQAAANGPGLDVLKLDFVGAGASPTFSGQQQLPSTSNYFVGTNPAGWHPDVPNFARAVLSNVYPGIDVAFYGTNSRTLEYEFIVHAGASPSAIQLNWEGVSGLSTDQQGNLDLQTADGALVEQAPVVYQAGAAGARQSVTVSTVLNPGGTVGFQVGSYDATKDLVIDPVLAFSTYLGGSGNDYAYGAAVDPTGDSYVVGSTASTNFPTTTGVIQGSNAGGTDAFVTKLNPAGNAVIYSTYLGGAGNDVANAVAVDVTGNAYVAGSNNVGNSPTGFVDKLSASGGQLVYSASISSPTGTNIDTELFGIAVDQNLQAYVTGSSTFQDSHFHDQAMAYKLTPSGAVAYSTSLASVLSASILVEVGRAVAVDASGNAFLTGQVTGVLGTTSGVLQTSYGGGTSDAFVAELNGSGTKVYATYLGGAGADVGYGITLDLSDDAYVTGSTASTNFPTTSGVIQTSNAGGTDAFVAKVNPTGTTLSYSTYLGGSGTDQGNGIAVDTAGFATVAGYTASTNFPTANALYSSSGGGNDAFVARLNPTGVTLAYSTYLGGAGDDEAQAVALDVLGNAVVAGFTNSTNFPTANPAQGSNAGGYDAFVSKIGLAPGAPAFTGISPDTGSSSSDQITTSQNLTISGTAALGSTVAVYLSGVGLLGTVTADPTTGVWSYNYSGTTLAEGTYAFTATASAGGYTSVPSQPFLVAVDLTAPAITVAAPASTTSLGPQVVVYASDLNGLPNGTAVTVDVDKNNDGNFTDPGESGYASGTLTNGFAVIKLLCPFPKLLPLS